MKLRSRLALALVPATVATFMSTVSALAQPYNYSDVVPTPSECDAAAPGGAFAAWVQLLPSKKVELELSTTALGDSAATTFSNIVSYANGQPKNLPADSFQFTVYQASSTGTVFPVIRYDPPTGPAKVIALTPTRIKNGFNGTTVYYDMHSAANAVPVGSRLASLYLLTYALPNGPFFGYFNNFYINGNPVHNKNFTTYPCVLDLAQQVINFTP